MEPSTNEASKKFEQLSLTEFDALISSQESAGGTLPSDSQAGPRIEKSGPAVVPANPSRWPENRNSMMTSVTSGPSFSGSSRSAVLQRSLVNKLIANMGGNGSRAYGLTWKVQAMPSGMPLLTLQASGRTRFDKGCIGWLTPRARGDAGGSRWKNGDGRNLEDQARIFCLSRGLTIAEVARLSLSPKFVRRLMGYPAAWERCAVTAMRLTPKSPPNS